MNIQELLNHLSEIKSTLGNGLVGQRLSNEGQVLSNNIQQSFPFLKRNPTINDLVNSFGMVGAIRKPEDIAVNLFGNKTVNKVIDDANFDRFNKAYAKHMPLKMISL